MPIFGPKFFSVVLLGRQNPQILNHDFLIRNQVLPNKREPFKSLIKNSSDEKPPFTQYLSTPLITTLVYKWISIIVDQERYQIKDSNNIVPSKSPIISITKKYFGELLRYTPFRLGGINFAGDLVFSDAEDEKAFDEKLGINCKKFEDYFKIDKAQYSTKISFPLEGDQENQIELRVDKPKRFSGTSSISFNFEFIYKKIDSFIDKLEGADKAYKIFQEILKKMEVETKK